jgi:hypothetical protein
LESKFALKNIGFGHLLEAEQQLKKELIKERDRERNFKGNLVKVRSNAVRAEKSISFQASFSCR